MSAAEAGTAHHKFLQHVALEKAGDLAALETEAQRLEREKILSADECAVLDLDALADFWNSPPGRKIRAQPPDSVKRELPFTAKFSPAELAEIIGDESRKPGWKMNLSSCRAWRIWSCCCRRKSGWWISRRTRFARTNCRGKSKLYTPQLKLYARALAKIYSRPVTNCWLHFLDAAENRGQWKFNGGARTACPCIETRQNEQFNSLKAGPVADEPSVLQLIRRAERKLFLRVFIFRRIGGRGFRRLCFHGRIFSGGF